MPAENSTAPHPNVPDPTGTPLADNARLWTAAPDVLADPGQVEDRRVWTRARDVLPGRRITDGRLVLAAWADHTFQARAEWDAAELNQLWLHPLTEPTGRPRVDRDGLSDRVRAVTAPGSERDALLAIIEDLADAFDRVVDAFASSRQTAKAVVRLLDKPPRPEDPAQDGLQHDLCAEQAVLALQWHARLPLRRHC